MPLSFLLVTKHGHAAASRLAETMRDWLHERGARAVLLDHPATDSAGAETLRLTAGEADVAVVLGGDGTFIGVARRLAGSGIRLMGVNFGRVGFLTDVPAGAWRPAFEAVLAGRLEQADRMLLTWEVERAGRIILSGHAVNDVVVGRGSLARVATLRLGVSECGPDAVPVADLGWIRADGIIVASPLGSSAYALSAGGPLVHPDISALLVTAIAPFLGSMPPLLVPGTARVHLECGSGSFASDTCLTVDGQEGHVLEPGDRVTVGGLDGALRLFTRPGGYLQCLRGRGFIRDFASGSGSPA